MQVLIIGGGGLGRALVAHYQQHGASVQVLSRQTQRIAAVIDGLSAEDSGGFWHWDGSALAY